MHEFNWRPGIGDPSVGGWLTVLLYVLAAISSWKTARQLDASESRLWRSISVAFLGLGLNKQLDLQTAITELGRILAYDEGWYGQRQIVQFWFIVAVAVTCLLVALVLLYLARRSTLQTWLGLLGVVLVLGFVVIRAASFHHVDRFIGTRILGLKWNWLLEMGGIVIVILSSEWRCRLAGRIERPPRSASGTRRMRN